MVTKTVKTSGPLFSPPRKVNVMAAMQKAMKGAVLVGEATIKKQYVRSPGANVIGGRKTGHLSRGVRGKVSGPYKAIIAPGRFVYGSDVPYSGVVEFGRSASMQAVKPRRRKALRFKPRGSSKYVFAKKTRPFKKALKGNPAFKNTAEDREYNAKVVKIFGKLYAGAIS